MDVERLIQPWLYLKWILDEERPAVCGYLSQNENNLVTLSQAVVTGEYEIKRTPAEQLREYYRGNCGMMLGTLDDELTAKYFGRIEGVRETLEILAQDYPELANVLDESDGDCG